MIPQEFRPKEFWLQSSYLPAPPRVYVQKFDHLFLIYEFELLALQLIQGIITARDAKRLELVGIAIRFWKWLRTRYTIRAQDWTVRSTLPPTDLEYDQIPWPAEFVAIVAQIQAFEALVDFPLLVMMATEFHHPDPQKQSRREEISAALRDLKASLPELQKLLLAIQAQSDKLAKPPPEIPAPAPIPDNPSESAADRFAEIRESVATLKKTDWQIMEILLEKEFDRPDRNCAYPTQERIEELLCKNLGNLKKPLGNLTTHQWLANLRGTGVSGGYYLTPKGLLALEFQRMRFRSAISTILWNTAAISLPFQELEMDDKYGDRFRCRMLATSDSQIVAIAKRLARSPLFRMHEWTDIAQELRLWLWQKLRWFDPQRGSEESFVSCRLQQGVAMLVATQRRPTQLWGRRLWVDSPQLVRFLSREREASFQHDLHADCQTAMTSLAASDQQVCTLLMQHSLTEVARQLRTPRSTLVLAVQRIRQRWESHDLQEYLCS